MTRCGHIEVTVSLVKATKALSQSTEKGLLDSKTVGWKAFYLATSSGRGFFTWKWDEL